MSVYHYFWVLVGGGRKKRLGGSPRLSPFHFAPRYSSCSTRVPLEEKKLHLDANHTRHEAEM